MKYKKSKHRATAWFRYRRVFVLNHGNSLPYGPCVEIGIPSRWGLKREIFNRKRKVADTWKRAYRIHHRDWMGIEE